MLVPVGYVSRTLYVGMLRVASICVRTGPVKNAATIDSLASRLPMIQVGKKKKKKWMKPLHEQHTSRQTKGTGAGAG
jgi:hypothetical protein